MNDTLHTKVPISDKLLQQSLKINFKSDEQNENKVVGAKTEFDSGFLPNRINVKLIKYDNRLKHETPKLEIHNFEIIQPRPILVKYRRLNSLIQLQK